MSCSGQPGPNAEGLCLRTWISHVLLLLHMYPLQICSGPVEAGNISKLSELFLMGLIEDPQFQSIFFGLFFFSSMHSHWWETWTSLSLLWSTSDSFPCASSLEICLSWLLLFVCHICKNGDGIFLWLPNYLIWLCPGKLLFDLSCHWILPSGFYGPWQLCGHLNLTALPYCNVPKALFAASGFQLCSRPDEHCAPH